MAEVLTEVCLPHVVVQRRRAYRGAVDS